MAEMRRNPPDVPYIVHEGEMVRLERVNRRLWALCTALAGALIAAGVFAAMNPADTEVYAEDKRAYQHGNRAEDRRTDPSRAEPADSQAAAD